MRTFVLGVLLAAAPAPSPMPPNTIPLSAMMQQLSREPGFNEAFLRELTGNPGDKRGPALLTPALVDELRKILLGKDWQRLDHFPGWTMGQINPTVRVVGHVVGHDSQVEGSATAGGAPASPAATQPLTEYLTLGGLSLTTPSTVSLDQPATSPAFVTTDYVSSLGSGVLRGDGPSPLAPMHAESTLLANVLNRLSMNGFAGVAPFAVTLDGHTITTPQALVQALLATGHTVAVSDSRYFANFGHLHYRGQDVMMPFYVNPLIQVPRTHRPLLVPVSHAEYEWQIRGPRVNAAVSFYFGIDGHAEFRTMDQLDQAWVMNRHAYEYRDAEAIEVTRLNGLIVQTYQRLHLAHPQLPFGGYYALGVCQDVVAAIELKLHGKTTLFPNTADASFFTDPKDAEINTLIRKIPKDRDGRPPQVERIFGSLPFGQSDADLATVTIPGLAPDLIAVHDAWTNGTLKRIRRTHHLREGFLGIGIALLGGILYFIRKRRRL